MAKKINENAHEIDIWYKVSLNLVQLGEGLMLLVNLLHRFAINPESVMLITLDARGLLAHQRQEA